MNGKPGESAEWRGDPREVIGPIIRSGGCLRNALKSHGMHPDASMWSGSPDVAIALEVLDCAQIMQDTCPPPNPKVADQRQALINRHRANMDRMLDLLPTGQVIKMVSLDQA